MSNPQLLEDREEPNKFYFKHRRLCSDCDDYVLGYSPDDDIWAIVNKEDSADFKTQFTQEEVKELTKKTDIVLRGYEVIKAEE